ncbi:uncharacterized protein LOC131950954 isoform X2 [Physella acuta]|uniref:uncharacterized protein LOC131950954 isoform X2 n=1 Tax=Physella acuta TaxID=109671 RepID=UPI0027DDAAB2|nr:uncharacterized protein LOC131950954 isoform X2 [Physella acuta]
MARNLRAERDVVPAGASTASFGAQLDRGSSQVPSTPSDLRVSGLTDTSTSNFVDSITPSDLRVSGSTDTSTSNFVDSITPSDLSVSGSKVTGTSYFGDSSTAHTINLDSKDSAHTDDTNPAHSPGISTAHKHNTTHVESLNAAPATDSIGIALDQIYSRSVGLQSSSDINRSVGLQSSSDINRSIGLQSSSDINRSIGLQSSSDINRSIGLQSSSDGQSTPKTLDVYTSPESSADHTRPLLPQRLDPLSTETYLDPLSTATYLDPSDPRETGAPQAAHGGWNVPETQVLDFGTLVFSHDATETSLRGSRFDSTQSNGLNHSTHAGIHVTPADINVRPAGIHVTPAGINVTPAGIHVTPAFIHETRVVIHETSDLIHTIDGLIYLLPSHSSLEWADSHSLHVSKDTQKQSEQDGLKSSVEGLPVLGYTLGPVLGYTLHDNGFFSGDSKQDSPKDSERVTSSGSTDGGTGLTQATHIQSIDPVRDGHLLQDSESAFITSAGHHDVTLPHHDGHIAEATPSLTVVDVLTRATQQQADHVSLQSAELEPYLETLRPRSHTDVTGGLGYRSDVTQIHWSDVTVTPYLAATQIPRSDFTQIPRSDVTWFPRSPNNDPLYIDLIFPSTKPPDLQTTMVTSLQTTMLTSLQTTMVTSLQTTMLTSLQTSMTAVPSAPAPTKTKHISPPTLHPSSYPPSLTSTPHVTSADIQPSSLLQDGDMTSTLPPSSQRPATTSSHAGFPVQTAIIVASVCAALVIVFLIVLLVCKRKSAGKNKPMRPQRDELWVDMDSFMTIQQIPFPSSTSMNDVSVVAPNTDTVYTANYTFTATQEGQLALTKGDKLQVFERNDNGWWRGVNLQDGSTGWFPNGFVTTVGESSENLSNKEKTTPLVCLVKPHRQVSSFQIKKRESPEKDALVTYPVLESTRAMNDVESWVNMAASGSMSSLTTTEKSYTTNRSDFITGPKAEHKYRVVYAYKPVCKGEMALKEGELVVCKERDQNGWMYGTKPKTNQDGWFPAVYVDEVSSDDESNCSEVPETYDLLESNKLHKVDQSWIGIEHKALYKYESSVPGDLKMEEDDVVVVLQTLANGWWFGTKGNLCGWFPGSYVEMLEADPPDLTTDSDSLDNTFTRISFTESRSHTPDLHTESRPHTPDLHTESRSHTPDLHTESRSHTPDLHAELESSHSSSTTLRSTTTKQPESVSPTHSAQGTIDHNLLNAQTSKKSLRPKRIAPEPPSSRSFSPIDSKRRPARPAPAPPIRQNSALRKESLQSNQLGGNQTEPISLNKHNVKRPVLLIHGKRPKLHRVPKGVLDKKQLNPMMRPSTRNFLRKPSNISTPHNTQHIKPLTERSRPDYHKVESAQGKDETPSADGSDANLSLVVPYFLNQETNHHKSNETSLHKSNETSLHKSDETNHQTSDETSYSGRSFSPYRTSSKDSTKPSTNKLSFKSPNTHGNYFPRERTPELKSGRSNSPNIPTSGNFLQNVKQFNRAQRLRTPSPCFDQHTNSETEQEGESTRPNRQHKMAAVSPPTLPHQGQTIHTSTNSRTFHPTNADLSSKERHPDGAERPEESGVKTDLLTVVPGKVSEIVQQINKLSPQ